MTHRLSYAAADTRKPSRWPVRVAAGALVLLGGALATSRLQTRIRTPSDNSVAAGDVSRLTAAIEVFHDDAGRYPTAAEGFGALLTPPADFTGRWRGPYLRRVPAIDPWGSPYLYRTRNRDERDGFEILCSGSDRILDTPDDIRTGFISDRRTESR